MKTFWENAFQNNQEMWGLEPALSTLLANDFFISHKVKSVLVPGIGYGRNAQLFQQNGMEVTGIEISKTAIDLAYKNFGNRLTIHHGSVSDMPFDNLIYDGIYCYALIHLLDKAERKKLIENCYQQLADNGFMIFTAVTKEAALYGQGVSVDKDTFEVFGGVKMFFYDRETIQEDFGKAGLIEIKEVEDVYPFYFIKCKKEAAKQLKI